MPLLHSGLGLGLSYLVWWWDSQGVLDYSLEVMLAAAAVAASLAGLIGG